MTASEKLELLKIKLELYGANKLHTEFQTETRSGCTTIGTIYILDGKIVSLEEVNAYILSIFESKKNKFLEMK